nr:ethylene-responsive transcription factor ERF071-like [Aegilops tauschii subsp. strangulata]
MPPRRESSSGYRGVRVHPSGWFYTEIRSGTARLSLGTFKTAHEAARAYDVVAWRLSKPRSQMNFHEAQTCQQAQDLASPPRLITDQDREKHRRRQRCLLIAETDELAMAEWRQCYPQDVADENAFWAWRTARRRAERADRRRRGTRGGVVRSR